MERNYMIQGIGNLNGDNDSDKSVFYLISIPDKTVSFVVDNIDAFRKDKLNNAISRAEWDKDMDKIKHIFDSDGSEMFEVDEVMEKLEDMRLKKKWGIINIKVETAK